MFASKTTEFQKGSRRFLCVAPLGFAVVIAVFLSAVAVGPTALAAKAKKTVANPKPTTTTAKPTSKKAVVPRKSAEPELIPLNPDFQWTALYGGIAIGVSDRDNLAGCILAIAKGTQTKTYEIPYGSQPLTAASNIPLGILSSDGSTLRNCGINIRPDRSGGAVISADIQLISCKSLPNVPECQVGAPVRLLPSELPATENYEMVKYEALILATGEPSVFRLEPLRRDPDGFFVPHF
jgi:hypothetical protein